MIDQHDGSRQIPLRARVRWQSAGRADPGRLEEPASGEWDGTPGVQPLEAALQDSARRDPDRLATIGPDGARSYAEIAAGALSVARFLASDAGVRPGNHVALVLDSTPAYAAAFHGV